MLKDQLFKPSRFRFDNWLFGPEKISGLSRNRPKEINEFYKKLWDALADQLVDVFNFSFQLEEMTPSQRQALITLIDKKEKDRSYLEDWRPISLVNVDAKMLSPRYYPP